MLLLNEWASAYYYYSGAEWALLHYIKVDGLINGKNPPIII